MAWGLHCGWVATNIYKYTIGQTGQSGYLQDAPTTVRAIYVNNFPNNQQMVDGWF